MIWVTPVAKKEMLQETNEASDNAITTQRRSNLSASQPERDIARSPHPKQSLPKIDLSVQCVQP